MNSQRPSTPRRKVRFAPEKATLAQVRLKTGQAVGAFVLDESYQGARLLIPHPIDLVKGDLVSAKVGELDFAPAEVRWVDYWEKQKTTAFGIEYQPR